jgi:hypothetical protein
MTAVTLPTNVLPLVADIRPIDNGVNVRSPFGGKTQRFDRLGSRHAVDYEMPALDADCAAAWIGARLEARAAGSTVRMPYPQLALATLPSLSALVMGAGQSGRLLNVDGLGAGTVVPANRAFHIDVAGRYYLYVTTTQVTANGSGQATLTLDCLLRAIPADNAALNFNAPVIEGWLSSADWKADRLQVASFPLTIEEAE